MAEQHDGNYDGWETSVERAPIVRINGMALGPVLPFFQNCATDCDDVSNGDVVVTLPATGSVIVGQNSFRITCGTVVDDIFVRNVTMSCVP